MDKVYAIGGASYTSPNHVTYSFATEEYDPLTDSWTTKADFPMPPPFNKILGNAYIGGASANGKIYVVVFNTEIPGTTATYEYDPIADIWDISKAPVPFSYDRFSVTSLNDKIYVRASNNFAEYDPLTDIWIIKPPSTTDRNLFGLAATNDKLYATGGMTYSSSRSNSTSTHTPILTFSTVEEFDMLANNWVVMKNTHAHCSSLCRIRRHRGKIYVIGGADDTSTPLSEVEEGVVLLSPSTSSLTISPPSGTYTTTQGFDLTLIVETQGLSVVGGSAKLNGADVFGALANCFIPGTLIIGGQNL